MNRIPTFGKAVAAMALLLSPALAHAQGKKVVAYVPNWIDLPTFVKTIDFDRITHLNIAFENPADDAGNLSFDRKNDSLIAAAKAHKVKVLISIGGGSAADSKVLKPRYFDLIGDTKRAGFVAKLTDYVIAHDFDGLDVDIEGPSINQDYGKFIDDLAAALTPKGKLLTAALSQGYGGDRVPDSALARFDFVNIMAYDGAGPWQKDRPGQHSSMEMAKGSVAYWLKRGLPKEKAVLGVPFYGYGFGDAYRSRDYPYSELVKTYPGAESVDQIGSTIWYNGLPTIRAKAQYVVDQKLAGIMIWSLDYDVKGKSSLLNALSETLQVKRP